MTILQDPFARTDMIDIRTIGAATASGNTASFNVAAYTGIACMILDCAAGTGTTPQLTNVDIQDSPNGSTGWLALATEPVANFRFATVTTTASLQRRFFNIGACRGFIRVAWTISGTTPSFNFSLILLARQT